MRRFWRGWRVVVCRRGGGARRAWRKQRPLEEQRAPEAARTSELWRAARKVGVALCAALFSAGVVWNLFFGALETDSVAALSASAQGSGTALWERRYAAERRAMADASGDTRGDTAEDVSGDAGGDAPGKVPDVAPGDASGDVAVSAPPDGADAEQDTALAVQNRLAELRMERDRGWEALAAGLETLEFAEKEAQLAAQETRRYEEQRLELLLRAKGVSDVLVLLGEKQANVVVEAETLAAQYEKVYDLVARNTDYAPEEIVLVPLRV